MWGWERVIARTRPRIVRTRLKKREKMIASICEDQRRKRMVIKLLLDGWPWRVVKCGPLKFVGPISSSLFFSAPARWWAPMLLLTFCGDPASGPGPRFTRVPRSCYPGWDRLLRIRHVDRFSGDWQCKLLFVPLVIIN